MSINKRAEEWLTNSLGKTATANLEPLVQLLKEQDRLTRLAAAEAITKCHLIEAPQKYGVNAYFVVVKDANDAIMNCRGGLDD